MNLWSQLFSWLGDPAHWSGEAGIPVRILEHLEYTVIAMVVAIVIAVPIGALVGHTGRGGFLLVGLTNGIRALPTLGVLTIVVLLAGLGLLPPMIALVILAIPSILAGTYAGIRAVEPSVVDAARGMGMRESEVLLGVELPNALPLIFGGIRSATLQVLATATIAAYVSLGGIGRYVIDGLSQLDYPQVLAGALLVAALAIVIDLLLALVQRYVVSPGLQRTRVRRRSAPVVVRATAVESGGNP